MTEPNYPDAANPVERAELELVEAPAPDVVHPFTGEALDVATAPTPHLARFLADVREYESLLREAKAIVSREAIRRMDLNASYTVRIEGYVLTSQSPEPSEDWDSEALHHDVTQLVESGAISQEAADRAVKAETVYKVQAAGIKALRKLGGQVKETIDRHSTEVEKRRYVTVKRAA